jgi:hypothetical protein
VAPASEIALYAQALRGAHDNVNYDEKTNTVHIRSWLDPVSRRCVPEYRTRCFGLANLTVYVHDSSRAHVTIDGREYTCFKRNPADATGRQSITLVDDSVAVTAFDEVDPLQRFGELRTDRAECYYRAARAFSGTSCLEVRLTGETGRASWALPDLSSRDTTHFRFAYRKTNPAARVTVQVRFRDGKVVTAAEDLDGAYGWSVPHRDDTAWHDVVLDYADLTNHAADAWVPRGPVASITLAARGKPRDRVFFDAVQFLRNPVHPPDPDGLALVAGRVDPPQDGVPVYLEVGEKKYTTYTRAGYFYFPGTVTRGSTVKLYARPRDRAARYSRRGRYFEVTRNEVELIIPLADARDANRGKPLERVNAGVSEIHADAGLVFQPKSLFVSSGLAAARAQEFRNEIQVSNLGFLDRDREFNNPDAARRVLLLGNCNLYGHSTPQSGHANTVLEGLLRQRLGYRVEVPALANSSVTFGRYWPYYRTFGRKFHPEVVCLFLQSSFEVLDADPDLYCRLYEYDVRHPPCHMFRSRPDGTLEQIQPDPEFFRYVGKDKALHARREEEKKVSFYYLGGIDWMLLLHRRDPLPPRGQQAFEHFKRIARFYRDEFRKDGSKMMIALSPELQAYAYAGTPSWEDHGVAYERERFPERIAAMCREEGIGFVDAGRYVREHYADPSMCGWRYDSHPSPYGFEWMAEAVCEYLLDTKFLDDLPYNDPTDPAMTAAGAAR